MIISGSLCAGNRRLFWLMGDVIIDNLGFMRFIGIAAIGKVHL